MLDAGATLGPHCVILPAASIGDGGDRRAGVAGHARRARCRRHPLDRQPDRAVGRARAPTRRASAGRRGTRRPLPARQRQQRLRTSATTTSTSTTGWEPTGSTGRPSIDAVATEQTRPAQPRPGRAAGVARSRSTAARRREVRRTAGQAARSAGRARIGRRPVPVDVTVRRATRSRAQRVGRRRLGGADRRRARRGPAQRRAVLVPVQRPPERQGDATGIRVTTDSAYVVVVRTARWSTSGRGEPRRPGSSSSPQPMATYLATVQIGRYEIDRDGAGRTGAAARRRCRIRSRPGCRGRLRPPAADDGAASPSCSGRYPFAATPSSSPTTSWRSRSRRKGLSIFGANHVDGEPHARAARRPRAGAPVVRQQPDRRRVAAHLAHEGFACYAEWLWSEEAGGADRRPSSPTGTGGGWPSSPRTSCWPTPGRS